MKDIEIKISKATRMIFLDTKVIGVNGENLQSNLVFTFTDEFVDGVGRLEYKTQDDEKGYFMMNKENESYILPVRNALALRGKITMQVCITQEETQEGIPLFKSNDFYVYVGESIDAVDIVPEGYDLWIETANAKIVEIDKALDDEKALKEEIMSFKEQIETNESTREENESTRQTNEITRSNNENARIENESIRISNEGTRELDEATRISNESERVSQENARQLAELQREAKLEEFTRLIENFKEKLEEFEKNSYLLLESGDK